MKAAKIKIAQNTKQVILKELKISNIDEVLSKKYSRLDLNNDIDKSNAKIYNKRITGSVRLQGERYYSITEFHNRINRIKNTPMPS